MSPDKYTAQIENLFEFICELNLTNASITHGEILSTLHQNGYSGIKIKNDDFCGEISIGLILGGEGIVVKRLFQDQNQSAYRYDYFNNHGEFMFCSTDESLKTVIVDQLEFEINNPIINHLYNYLNQEYRNAQKGLAHSAQIHLVEKIFSSLFSNAKINLGIKRYDQDPAIQKILHKKLILEKDPVLSWAERKVVRNEYVEQLSQIIDTKIRVHKLFREKFKLTIFKENLVNQFRRYSANPWNNIRGLLHLYTIGNIIWFFKTVRNNLGYSVALAVYGPFTYYFITMPMNPHAMQAVGEVRSTYLNAKETLNQFFKKSDLTLKSFETKNAVASTVTDKINTKASAISKSPPTSNIIFETQIAGQTNRPMTLEIQDKNFAKVTPKYLNIPLTSEVDAINNVSWNERMGKFKQMQIAFEKNIEFASRMGRLEQLETQYNFPMQAEATWNELEKYNTEIFKIRNENPQLSAKLKQYLFNEVNRTQQLQLYIWDRMGRFILDQIYVMLDQDQEQKRNDYYIGRSFVFMEEMTKVLAWRHKDIPLPKGYEQIKKLADLYQKRRVETGNINGNLASNSDLFKQKNILDSKEFRSYMKRQWEILYLQNSKAEEASNMGLNMYIWSVRNTIWALQTIYSAKYQELSYLLKSDKNPQNLNAEDNLLRQKLSLQYETLFHNMNLEFVGIKEEISQNIGKDLDGVQRNIVLQNIQEFITDREKLNYLPIVNNLSQGQKL